MMSEALGPHFTALLSSSWDSVPQIILATLPGDRLSETGVMPLLGAVSS